jgi:hypothetical protein
MAAGTNPALNSYAESHARDQFMPCMSLEQVVSIDQICGLTTDYLLCAQR